MFNDSTVRFIARAVLAALLAGLSAAGGVLVDGDFSVVDGLTIATAVVGSLAVFAGVGAATPIDHSVGNK